MLLSTGMLAGLLALGVGVHGVGSAAKKLTEIGGRVAASGAPPSPEERATMARLQGRMRTMSRIAAVLLLVAVVTMALGPHL
jgi:hypothetical protein